jgi:transcriptional regulator with XRE-family HTH domain
MTENFIRERINELRQKKGISEYQMSYDLGRSRCYMQNISSGKCLPLLKDFLSIIEYLDVTPAEFFSESVFYSDMKVKALNGVRALRDEELEDLIGIIGRLHIMREVIENLSKNNQKQEIVLNGRV